LALACTASAQTNNWIKPASGNWEDGAAWSLGHPPAPAETIVITNQGWKAVEIGPAAASRDVGTVILGGYTDSFNLLLLNYAGLLVPLTASSVNVGTNSGITALASALDISPNSGSGDLTIYGVFNQGEQALVNSHLINLGNYYYYSNGAGIYNETNGIITADELSIAGGSTFNQLDGSNTFGTVWSGAANSVSNYGRLNIGGGSLTANSIELIRGDFKQTGGSVTAGLDIGAGNYTLSAGTLHLPGITLPSASYGPRNPGGFLSANATLLQTGGTNFCNGSLTAYHVYGAPGIGSPFLGPGRYVLSNGVLCVTGTVQSWLTTFEQWGGWHTNAGTQVKGETFPGFEIRTGSFTLGGGTLITPSINLGLGNFAQSGGTNLVSGEVGVGLSDAPASFTLSGGLLADVNTSIAATNPASPGGQYAVFIQTGGTHIITNLLRMSGPLANYPGNTYFFGSTGYVLNNGALNVPNIEMETSAVFNHLGGTLITSGLLSLGYATWNERTTGQQFGQLLLSAPAGSNATFSLPPANCVVHFVNSSSVAWSLGAWFSIAGWNGSPAGGGQHQIIFGSNSSGLTAQQVSQIQFVNPSGVSGVFPAAILPTGEVVPARLLVSQRTSNGFTLQWGRGSLQSATNVVGPYQDVPGATNPYSVSFTEPRHFFRLKY